MIAINADVGECGSKIDAQMMPHLDMASIACGGHIGNRRSMLAAVLLAKKYRVKIGAHLSYVDKENFGRISKSTASSDLFIQLKTQLLNLKLVCQTQAVPLSYIKPHGALYHDILTDMTRFMLILKLIKNNLPKGKLVVQAAQVDTPRKKIANKYRIPLLYEAFADRVYRGKKLTPRSQKNALLSDKIAIKKQYQQLLEQKNMAIDTVCFHSDNPASVLALRLL